MGFEIFSRVKQAESLRGLWVEWGSTIVNQFSHVEGVGNYSRMVQFLCSYAFLL